LWAASSRLSVGINQGFYRKLARADAAGNGNITIQIACLAVFIVVLGDQGNQSSAYSSNPEFFNSIQRFSHGIEVKTGKGLIRGSA